MSSNSIESRCLDSRVPASPRIIPNRAAALGVYAPPPPIGSKSRIRGSLAMRLGRLRNMGLKPRPPKRKSSGPTFWDSCARCNRRVWLPRWWSAHSRVCGARTRARQNRPTDNRARNRDRSPPRQDRAPLAGYLRGAEFRVTDAQDRSRDGPKFMCDLGAAAYPFRSS